MNTSPKVPPRFVPTLTDVVRPVPEESRQAPAALESAEEQAALPADTLETQTAAAAGPADHGLDEVIPPHGEGFLHLGRGVIELPVSASLPALQSSVAEPGQDAAVQTAHSREAEAVVSPLPKTTLDRGEELVHRLMQKVDLELDQRLREAIASVVQEQTRTLVARMREEVEFVVRQAVYEAVADELAQQAQASRNRNS
ncbi:hypothetical protein [Comamonas composti]|uniref:hypothetical protein n=1 Tax=Comamonas composti TaxID=408558 RepID=UPI00042A2B3D|nr:hypothetical protein [Comamonas composti]